MKNAKQFEEMRAMVDAATNHVPGNCLRVTRRMPNMPREATPVFYTRVPGAPKLDVTFHDVPSFDVSVKPGKNIEPTKLGSLLLVPAEPLIFRFNGMATRTE